MLITLVFTVLFTNATRACKSSWGDLGDATTFGQLADNLQLFNWPWGGERDVE